MECTHFNFNIRLCQVNDEHKILKNNQLVKKKTIKQSCSNQLRNQETEIRKDEQKTHSKMIEMSEKKY